MPVITISRGSYSRGKEVAESLAKRLGYECVSRDILLEASSEFNIPEIKLVKALHDAPSVLDRFRHGRERYISYFLSAFLTHMSKDNVVYHGLGGHFFLQEISHVLKIRIIANMDDRVREEMKRESCSADQARHNLKKDDEERRKWGLHLYGRDTWDSRLYDMVLHIDTMSVEDVVGIIADTAEKKKFQATPESMAKLRERTLLANIHARIVDLSPEATVRMTEKGVIVIGNLEGSLKNDPKTREETAYALRKTFALADVVFDESGCAPKDHLNTFFNIDIP